MKKIYKLESNSSIYYLTYNFDDEIIMYLDNIETNTPKSSVLSVSDDSSWTIYENIDLNEFENKWLINVNILEEYTFFPDSINTETIKKVIYEIENNYIYNPGEFQNKIDVFRNTCYFFDYDFEIYVNNNCEIVDIKINKSK